MDLLEKVKCVLRISCDDFDEPDIKPLMEACKRDLIRNGIKYDDTDPLSEQAVKTYCKAYFGNNPNSEKLQKSYDTQVASLALSRSEYGNNDTII